MCRKWFRLILAKLKAQLVPKTFKSLFERYWVYLFIYVVWLSWMIAITTGPGGFAAWLNGFHRWDAELYFRIWNFGYGEDPRTLVFPPGYSWLTGLVSSVAHIPFDLAAMVVNIPSFFAAGVLAAEFMHRKFRVSWLAVFVLHLSFPVALYVFVPYSDCLFDLFFWGALTLADRDPKTLTRDERVVAWALLFFAPFVRLTGFALAIWIFFRRWFALAVFPTLGLFMLGNYLVTGDPFYFIHVQIIFMMPNGWLWDGVKYHLHDLVHLPRYAFGQGTLFWVQVTVLPWISLFFLTVSALWLARRKEWMIALTIIAVALFSRNQAYWRSVFRYDLPLATFVGLPYLWWANKENHTLWPRLKSRAASVFFAILVIVGFIFEWGFVRRLHVGAWIF